MTHQKQQNKKLL